MCPNLVMLHLGENLISNWFDTSYLPQLNFIDLSQNKLSDSSNLSKLSKSIVMLRLHGNPLCSELDGDRFTYRKPFVLALPELEELDGISVIAAERLSYQGLLPKKVKVFNVLTDLERKAKQRFAD